MREWVASVALLLVTVRGVMAAESELVCFGNEPSWSVVLEGTRAARLILPDQAAVAYMGSETRLDVLRERIWRGAPASGGGDLVVFLRDADCSDQMSDQRHPVVVRVSLPDGRMLAGCCRVGGAAAARTALDGPEWRLTALAGQSAETLAALPAPLTARFRAGTLHAFAGCNQVAGGYTVDGDRLHVGALAGTMMACPTPAMEIERTFTGAFRDDLRIRVDGDRLTLQREGGTEPTLVFVAASPPRIDGVSWEVTGFNNGRQAVVGPLAGTSIQVTFADGAVTGHAGCNTFRGTWRHPHHDKERLEIGPISVTRKRCPGKGVMEQEREFLAALATASVWTIDRGMLDVHRPDGERVLTAHPSGR